MSDLQKLGRELDYFYEDVQELLPNYTESILQPLYNLFEELIKTGTPQEEENTLILELYQTIKYIQDQWRGILSEINKN